MTLSERMAARGVLRPLALLALFVCLLAAPIDALVPVVSADVPPRHMDAPTVDARYRDVQQVERNFRTLKTGFLEVRPIFLRKAARTKAHVFIALLALKVTRLFEQRLHRAFGTTDEDPHILTLEDALTALSRITYLYYPIQGKTVARLPRPDATQLAIFSALGLSFPTTAARAL